MPVAHVSGAIGAAASQMLAMQQAQAQQKCMQAQMQAALQSQNQLAQYQQSQLTSLGLLNAYVPYPAVAPKRDPMPVIDRGEQIIGEIAFWQAFPFIGKRMAERRAEHLDSISETLERMAEMEPANG